jgi:ribosome maturation factor RimP
MQPEGRVAAIAEPVLEAMGFQLVGVRFVASGRPELQVIVEHPGGSLSIQDCARVSEAVSARIAAEVPDCPTFNVVVSSPGIPRPLMRHKDFVRYAGFDVDVETSVPIGGRQRFKGRLVTVNGEGIALDVSTGDAARGKVDIRFAEIAAAKLVLTDELIEATLARSRQEDG